MRWALPGNLRRREKLASALARMASGRSALVRDEALPVALHRAQARSYMMCAAVTDGSHSHACNASAKQANLLWLV